MKAIAAMMVAFYARLAPPSSRPRANRYSVPVGRAATTGPDLVYFYGETVRCEGKNEIKEELCQKD